MFKLMPITFMAKTQNNKAPSNGFKIVLTSSKSEMSHYHNDPFVAFTCTFPHKLFPKNLLKKWFAPERNEDGTVKYAPYGLRKVETLLRNEFGSESVVVTHYDDLDKFVGPNTKLVGISTMDPMGLAYVSTTYNSLIGFGGESLNSHEFKELMNHPVFKKYKPKIMVGGAGVWQIRDSNMQDAFGIDVLFQGESEVDLIPVVKKLLDGAKVDKYIIGQKSKPQMVPIINHAATYGTVEITRGCGRGCQFCTPTMRKKYSFPLEHIMKEVAQTVKCGAEMIFTSGEDMFLYKSKPGFIPNREEVVKLYKTIAAYPGVKYIHLSHASLAPIIYDKKILEELSPILLEKTRWGPHYKKVYKKRFITVEVGLESGSVRIMKKLMKGKALPFSVDNWPELVVQGIGNMNDYDWWPLCTIMTGLPGETEDDVIATINLIDDLKHTKMFFTPILFIPIEEAMLSKEMRPSLENLTELHWEFIAKCWRYNIDFWGKDYILAYNTLFFFTYLLYARWKHGKKATVPLLKLAGMPDSFIQWRVNKSCEPQLCEA